MQAKQTVGIDLPLKALVWQDASGKTWLSYTDPRWMTRSTIESPTRRMPDTPKTNTETIRIHQANERTMLAWIRTGIALMAFGFAIARFGVFLREVAGVGQVAVRLQHGVGSAWVGAVLVALGMLANLLATVRYARIRHAIERGEVGAPHALMVYVFGGTATAVGIVMTVLLVRALGE